MSTEPSTNPVPPGSLQEALTRYHAGLDAAVAQVVGAAAATVPAFATRLSGAGTSAEVISSVADLSVLPVLTKDDVLALQQQDPPYGGMLAPGAPVTRVFQSPGPLYEPQLAGVDVWRWGQALTALGVGSQDTVINCFGYHLSPAAAMFEEGCLAVGARVLPAGIGAQDLQVRAIADLGITAYTGLPSYLKALVERFDEAGLDRASWRLQRALVTAEPLPDSLRALLEQRIPTVRMAYGTAETGLLAYETEAGGGLVPADGVLLQVCDLDTGLPLIEGQGQVVVTLLRPDYPMVRFGTGDLSAWTQGPDGRPRLAGVLGRVGQAVKVKGMFLHPHQVAAVMTGAPGVAQYRFLIGREDHVDTLACEVVLEPGAQAGQVTEAVRDRVRSGLRFGARVQAVEQLTEGEGPLVDTRDWS